MRAQTIYEDNNFERGQEPKKAMKIGLGTKKYIPNMVKKLELFGLKVRLMKVDESHIRWDIFSPIREAGNYYEIAWLEEESLKSGEFGYYLAEDRDKNHPKYPQKGFLPDPSKIIDKIIEYEMEGLDEELRNKRTEHSLLESEIERLESFRNKTNKFSKNES